MSVLLSLVAFVDTAGGQSVGGDVPHSRVVPVRDQVEQQLTSSAIRLGPFRIEPTLELRNFGYFENVFATPEGEALDDYGGTVAAGVDFLMPMGEKVYFRGFAMPEYTYFLDIENLRRFSGSYGGELLGLFNQLSLQAGAATSETLQSVSSEIEAPAISSTDAVYAIGEIRFVERFSLYTAAQTTETSVEEEEGIEVGRVERLDREVMVLQGGLRYDVRSYLQISALYEATETEHSIDPLQRDFETTAILGAIRYDTPRFYLNLSAGPREIESVNPGAFESYSTVTGSAYLAYEMGVPAVISLFGNRSLRGSAFAENAIFIEDRMGMGLETRLGERVRVRFGGAVGENDYPLDDPTDGSIRVDDTEAVNAGLSWRLFRSVWLNVDANETDYDSNIDQFDRNILRVTTTLSLK